MDSKVKPKPLTHDDYTVGWVCALPKEQTAATAMLDQIHNNLPKPSGDTNAYTLGSIGQHNIVIACLPKGKFGTNSAATVATRMIGTFPCIKVGLMVGIGGGIPPKVRLGDVVISTPIDQFPGVVQWDFGKAKPSGKVNKEGTAEDEGTFERTGSLNNPPISLLTALAKLETDHDLKGSKISEYLKDLERKWPRLVPKYLKSASLKDVLFKADYNHANQPTRGHKIPDVDDIRRGKEEEDGDGDDEADDEEKEEEEQEEQSCKFCDSAKTIKRKPRDMRIHYGLIASGNQVIKDAALRDRVNKNLGGHVLCVEMEAAGLMDNFPCIVIRGICDYADSHKNKAWQEHAAAVAAAFAKELLGYVQPSDFEIERPVKDTLDQVLCSVKEVQSKLDKKEDMEVLNWLTPIDFDSQQTYISNQREPGTGQWLLETTEYQAWMETDGQTLLCSGNPGAGKTFLTSLVVDNLKAQSRDDQAIGIAYIYLNFQDKQEPQSLLSSLLKQLTRSQSFLPDSVRSLQSTHRNRQTMPSRNEISQALQSVAALHSRVYLIIDALDECRVDDGDFLDLIIDIQKKTRANLFATSRFNQDMKIESGKVKRLTVIAKHEDVEKYLDSQMSRLTLLDERNHDVTKERKEELRKKVKTKIVEAVNGVFLLARLHLESLIEKTTPCDLIAALERLPKGEIALAQAYRQTIERIRGQRNGFRCLAERALSLLTCAERLLTTLELREALAVRAGEMELDKDKRESTHLIILVCAGLVVVDEDSDIIRLAHSTTLEYLADHMFCFKPNEDRTSMENPMTIDNQKNAVAMAHAHNAFATICCTYLSFDRFKSGPCRTYEEFGERLHSNPLYDYAANNWGHHARKTATSCQSALRFLKCSTKAEAATQAMRTEQASQFAYSRARGLKKTYEKWYSNEWTGLHLAAYFGVTDVASALLDGNGMNLEDSHSRTPLWHAAANDHSAFVKLLLDTGMFDVNTKDCHGETPLYIAARKGHNGVVEALLHSTDIIPDGHRVWGIQKTPLACAAANGHVAVVRLLIAEPTVRKVDLNSRGARHQTPLLLAVKAGHHAVVEVLIKINDIAPDVIDFARRTPLSYAAEKGHVAIVQLLLDTCKVDINSKDQGHMTPLSYAAQGGHVAIVQLLLDTCKVDINSKDQGHMTPLSYAARGGHAAVVNLLLETGQAEADYESIEGCSPLYLAEHEGSEAVVKLLLKYNCMPLWWAAKHGRNEVVKSLLERGDVDLNSESKSYGETPLLLAANYGQDTVVKLLLEKDGVEVDSPDRVGRTPLFWAVEKGFEKITRMLLQKGAQADTLDRLGVAPLHTAAEQGQLSVARALLEMKATVDMPIKKHWKHGCGNLMHYQWTQQTPLHLAIKNGHEALAILLLEWGASITELSTKTFGIGKKEELEEVRRELQAARRGPSPFDTPMRGLRRGYKTGIQIRMREEKSVLHLAVSGDHKRLVSILEEKGASLLSERKVIDEYRSYFEVEEV